MALMKPPRSGVRVRMYDPGFGDCFLLAFRGPDRKAVYVLIDCGVHGAFKGGSEQIRKVIADIREATGGKIDLVVVTHEHADHVSGFYLGRDLFAGKHRDGSVDKKGGIEVEQVWFGWTEDPRSRKAKRLDKVKRLLLQGLHAAPAMSAEEDDSVRSMLGFYAIEGGEEREGALRLDGNVLGVSTRDARDEIRDHAAKSRYLKPKQEPLTIPGVDNVRVFVLGPPEEEEFLLRPNPTGEEGEVFEGEEGHHMAFRPEEALVAALGAAGEVPVSAGDPPPSERFQPFSSNHRRHLDKVRLRPDLYPFFHRAYGFEDADTEESSEADSDGDDGVAVAWRRIDEVWKNSANGLAIKLDAATNNSSLVLAIELDKSRRVLLFPGDAQVGNCKSWHRGGWSHENGLARGEKIDARDLLSRTVLYKVGHHGSHNATLKKEGLDLMTSDELIALIPVDEEWARGRRPHSWKMPFGPLYEELKTRTRGRIVRTDEGVVRPSGRSAKAREQRAAIDAAWKEFPGCAPVETALYTELVIPDT